ncbi:MAG: DMT family transporter [Rhizobiales bacterium]|nr:DMT family transporter [Hyphomicrobiales bacterium]
MSGHVQGAELRGIALLCIALVFFSSLDTIAKYLATDLPVLQIVWVRFLTHAVFMVVIFRPRQALDGLVSANLRLQIARAVLLFATTLFNFLAVRELQLSVTVSIMFTAPLIIAALSVPLLGEVVGARRWAAIIIGFVGVLLVTGPRFGDVDWAIIFSFAAAACFALYALATREVARFDSAITTILYTPLAGAIVLAPAMPFMWVSPIGVLDWGLLIVTGALGGYGHYLMVLAHRAAPAALLAPFIYTQIISMVFLGLIVFGDIPAATTLAGAAIVIASGLYLLYRTRRAQS